MIKPNIERIDFSGFEPLLDRISAVLEHYSKPGLGSKEAAS